MEEDGDHYAGNVAVNTPFTPPKTRLVALLSGKAKTGPSAKAVR